MIGITTTVPVEILFAAGHAPVDLNNLFIADKQPAKLVQIAENAGIPVNTCSWIKGIYGAIHAYEIKEVVGVVAGDCSDATALLDILKNDGVTVHPFAFPYSRHPDDLEREMERFARRIGTDLSSAIREKEKLDSIRALGTALDEDAAKGTIDSNILFSSLLLLSDFAGGNLEACREKLSAAPRTAKIQSIRLACVGVPTILSDLWDVFERAGARCVDHETPRQFARLGGIGKDLISSYLDYTYPYDVFGRISDIQKQVENRGIQGIVHYTQSFCHRQMHDQLLREHLGVPILTIEADRPGKVDPRTLTRIEAFIEQLESYS